MTSKQIGLVKETWLGVAAISDQAAAIFYAKLFELDPELRPLFQQADMQEQGKKLMQMIGVAVANLHKLDEVAPAVADLGRRHVDYGVKDADYDTVGHALLWTLGQGLGDAFTPDVERAWGETYGTLASVMKTAAAQAAA
jgi:hemoglobin-like flavoprotein